MAKFQTTAQIAAYCLNPERQLKDLVKQDQDLQRQIKKANQELERLRKEHQKLELESENKEQKCHTKEWIIKRGVLGMLIASIDREDIVKAFNITFEDIDRIQEQYKDESKELELLYNRLTQK